MKMKRTKKALSLVLCMVLIVAMALFTTGCNDKAAKKTTAATEAATTAAQQTTEAVVAETETTAAEETTGAKPSTKEVTVLGEGSKVFEFSVVDLDGNETWFEINTDEETVGAALLALELISGDEGPYGLYVKEANGVIADYEKDKTYWAFYVNGEYGMSGVDMTPIEEGTIYSFRISK